jgi:hypothetical protein
MSVDERLRVELRAAHHVTPVDTGAALASVRDRATRQAGRRRLGAATLVMAAVALAVTAVVGGWVDRLGADAAPAAPAPQRLSEQDLVGDWLTPLASTDTLVSSARRGENVGRHEPALRRVLGDGVPQRELALSVRYGDWTLIQRYVGGEWETVDQQEVVSVDGDRVTLRPLGTTGSTVLRVVRSEGPAAATLSLQFVSTSEPDSEGVPAEEILRALYTTFPFVAAPK